MRLTKLFFALVVLTLLSVGTLYAATINVPTDQATIQAALDVAGANDIVVEAAYALTNEALTVNEAGETIAGGGKTIASITVAAAEVPQSVICSSPMLVLETWSRLMVVL